APAHRAQELVQVDFERRKDRVGPVLHLEARLARLATGVLDDLLSLALSQLDDLGLRRLAHGLFTCLAEDSVAFALGLREHLLALLHDPAGLLDLLRNRRAHLVEDVVDLLAVDAYLVGERDGLGIVNEVVELVDENEYVHVVPEVYSCGETGAPPFGRGNISRNRLATGSGTRSRTSPPSESTSLTPLEERKLYCGLDIKYMVSTSGARFRFRWCIWNSHSKSEIARRPLTIVLAPHARANSTTSSAKTSTSMLSWPTSASRRNWTRSSTENIAFLCCGSRTTPTTTRSKIPAARVMMSRWPFVTGSEVPGRMAVIVAESSM